MMWSAAASLTLRQYCSHSCLASWLATLKRSWTSPLAYPVSELLERLLVSCDFVIDECGLFVVAARIGLILQLTCCGFVDTRLVELSFLGPQLIEAHFVPFDSLQKISVSLFPSRTLLAQRI